MADLLPEQKVLPISIDKYTTRDNYLSLVAKDNPKDKIEVEIGDSKDLTKFQPQLKVMRWDNEVNVSVRLKGDTEEDVISSKNDKVVLSKSKREINLYELSEGEGGYEFEIILKEKPTSNVMEFSIETKGVNFFYQPSLKTEILEEGYTSTDTAIFDKDGNLITYRPEEVVGSYAVYASENKVNYVGGKEYKCGKVGHIYRPRIEDAVGNWTWGVLNIDVDKKELTVTIPQKFLDNAVYPIRHAAGLTFGYTADLLSGTSLASNSTTNYIRGYIATGAAGTGVSMSVRVNTFSVNDANAKVKCALYTSANNTLLTDGTTATRTGITSTFTWYELDFSSAPTLTAVDYKLCAWGDYVSRSIYIAEDSTENTGVYENKGSNFTTWTSPMTWDGTGRSEKFAIYVTYTAAAAEGDTFFIPEFQAIMIS